ncbi:MAG: hypothetical protein ACI861_000664 [Paracoccaceae bacterium]|jgi:hypothetical protein
MPPNDGNRDTCFSVLDGDSVHFERLKYDVASAVGAMEQAGLRQGYQESLKSGYWPNEDVLPKSMRR